MTPVFAYPSAPQNIDQKIIDPSPAFRQEVFKVLRSIVYFILIYILLVAGAIVLAVLCGLLGFWLITVIPKIFTIMIGIGLVGLGVMVLFFLFKFVFSSNTVDRSHLIEITAKDQPVLFDFLRKVARETQTPFPKRVYLSPDVNACVFYDSGFWSMFFPVRKNLQIGLGLVNSVNVSEFKAIIAHEFGHFSQRSMKLGSYVYNVNKVIYNMLYDNNSYRDSLESWAGMSSYFTFFATLTGGIVSGIQSILQLQYTSINKRYMALSRQMEFHADSVAASVSGSKPLITSLRRLDVANECYDRVLQYYNAWYRENRKGVNVYQHHAEVMKHQASVHGLKIENGIVQVTADSFAFLAKSRIVVKDQWASHPSTDDRERHLSQLNITAEVVTDSAWTLFTAAENLQQEVTDHLYQSVTFKSTPEPIDLAAFCALYYAHAGKYNLDPRYKGFYDSRNVTPFDLREASTQNIPANHLTEILTEAVVNLPYRIAGLEMELRILEAIQQRAASAITFEFNGKKYNSNDAEELSKNITKELEALKDALGVADKDIFVLQYKLAAANGNAQLVCDAYAEMFENVKIAEEEQKRVDSILKEVSQLFQGAVTEGMAHAINNNMKREEIPIRKAINEMLADERYASYYTATEKQDLETFASDKHREYFVYPRLERQSIERFVESLNIYVRLISDRSFDLKKQALTKYIGS